MRRQRESNNHGLKVNTFLKTYYKPNLEAGRRKKFNLKDLLLKSKSVGEIKRQSKKKRKDNDQNSNNLNSDYFMSRGSTPSEFPFVKNAVKFLLKNQKSIKSNASRALFSPFSMQNLGSPTNDDIKDFDTMTKRNASVSQRLDSNSNR